jgi:uncharacterized SAM-binding protein YcdF (DUF218 family)
MSVIRVVIETLTAPLGLALLLALAALMGRFAGRPRASRALLACAGALAYLVATPLIGHALLRPLESRYAPLPGDRPPAVGYVVVLGSGYVPHDGIPVSAALDDDGLVRIVEAVRLLRALPGSRLVVSGGAPPGRVPAAEGYAQLARSVGTAPESIVLCAGARNTRDEASAVRKLLGTAPFLLVTSAYHMPRAMMLMRRAGAAPIAAPTGQRAFGTQPIRWSAFVPGSGGLRDSERAVHEYLGLAAIAAGLE